MAMVMLVEDYKYDNVPQSISNLLGYFELNTLPPSKNHILIGFLHILMLEMGFVPQFYTEEVEDCDFNYKRVLKLSYALTGSWKTPDIYQMEFVLRSAPTLICTLICVPLCEDLLVNCVVKNFTKNLGTFSYLLDPLLYFISSNIDLKTAIFQNLDHLSRNFKDQIAFPAKVLMVRNSGGVCGCFQNLPVDLVQKIMSGVWPKDLLRLAESCRAFCKAAISTSLWVGVLDAKFKSKNIDHPRPVIKLLYETKYVHLLREIWIRKKI